MLSSFLYGSISQKLSIVLHRNLALPKSLNKNVQVPLIQSLFPLNTLTSLDSSFHFFHNHTYFFFTRQEFVDLKGPKSTLYRDQDLVTRQLLLNHLLPPIH